MVWELVLLNATLKRSMTALSQRAKMDRRNTARRERCRALKLNVKLSESGGKIEKRPAQRANTRCDDSSDDELADMLERDMDCEGDEEALETVARQPVEARFTKLALFRASERENRISHYKRMNETALKMCMPQDELMRTGGFVVKARNRLSYHADVIQGGRSVDELNVVPAAAQDTHASRSPACHDTE